MFKLKQQPHATYIPHEVVSLQLKYGLSLIAAWRKYKKMSQAMLGKKLGISQPGVAQMEKNDVILRACLVKK